MAVLRGPISIAAALSLATAVLLPGRPGFSADLSSCVAAIRKATVAAGIGSGLAGRALEGVAFDEKAVRFSRTQPEYRTPIWDYMAFLVDRERIVTGQAMLEEHGSTLKAVEGAYGVDRHVIAAVWGIESDYGREKGEFFLPHALANVACAGRKPAFFRRELIEALRIVERGDLKLADLRGSWAGAFGQTQFLPSTYRRLAVDFDRDGRRDLVHSVPDALASTANFLRKAGWAGGQPWGYEVRLPAHYRGPSGRTRKAPVASYAKLGVTRIDGAALQGSARAGLILPAGPKGPAFLVFRNFDALYAYNNAESYALAISHLSDRLKGRPALATPWPTNDPGLSRRERRELQKLLIARGHDIGQADGRIGPVTIKAIKQVQQELGMTPNGRPSSALYKAMGGH
jgi:lytic murein transglycosylase